MNIFGIENEDDDSTIDNNMWNSPPRSSTKQKHRVTNNNRGGRDTTSRVTHRRNESLDKLRLLSASHQQQTKKDDNKVATPNSAVVESISKDNNVQRDRKDRSKSVERVGNDSITIDKRTQQYSDNDTKQQPSLIAAAAIKQLQEASLQNKIQQTSSFNELDHPKHSSYSKLEQVANSDDGISAESEEGYITKSKRSTLRNVIRSVSPLSRNNIRSVSPVPSNNSYEYTKDGKKLPPGWKEAQDVNTKQVYYYHLDGRVSWSVPLLLQDKKKSKRSSSLTRKKRGQSRNVVKRQGSRGRSSSVDTNNREGQRRASSLKATSRYSSTTPLQRHQRHSSLSLNHDEKKIEKQYKQSTSQEVEKRVTFQDDHSQQQEKQGRGRSSRPTSPTSFFPLRSRQRSASPSMFGRRISDLSRSLSPTRILPTVGGGCAAMNFGSNNDSPTQSISNYASSLVPSSVSNLLLFQCGGGGLGNGALGNSKEDENSKVFGEEEDNELLEETQSKETNENKKTTIDGEGGLKVPMVRVDSLVLKSNTEDIQEEQEVCCTTIERSYSTPIPSLLDGVEDGEGESEVHHRGHRRTMSGSINKRVKGKGNKASNRSLEALNLMKGRVKKSRMAVQPPKMKTKPSSTPSSSVPPLAKKGHRRSTSWSRSATSPMKRFSHRRSLSTGGGNVFASSSLATQSSPLTRSASFSSGLPKSSAAAAAVIVDDDTSAHPQAITPSDRGIADNTSDESPTGVDDDLNLLTHETKFLAEITKTAIPTPPLCDSRDVQQSNKRGHRIHMKSDMLSQSTSPPGESSPVRPLNLDEILKSSTSEEQEVSARKKKKSVATLMSTDSSIVELALIEKANPGVSKETPVVSNSRNSFLDKEVDAAAQASYDSAQTSVVDDDKSISAEALTSSEDDNDDLSPVVPSTSSFLASTKDISLEEASEPKDTDTPQQEYDDAILMLKSHKQRRENTPAACQTSQPPARWPPVEEEQTTLKYSIARESEKKGEDDSISSSSVPSEPEDLPAVYMNDEHDMRSTSTNTSSKFNSDIGQFNTVVSVNSMSAIYSQDEDKMIGREKCAKNITKRDINSPNDFDSIAAESELTADTVFDTTRPDVLPTVDETKSIVSTAQQQRPTSDKKFDPSHCSTTTQDCNYSTTLDSAYEEFGVERQLAIVDENGKKTRQGMKLKLIKPRNFGLPWKPSKPVDVDETSFAISLADNSVKSTNSNNSGDDEEVGQLDWLCGDMCGNEEDIVNDEYTTAGFTTATQGKSIMTTSSQPKSNKDNKFDKIMDVMEYVLTGYKACETEFDCQTEYDEKTVDTGLGLDDETNVHSQKSRNENMNGVANIDAIRMQGMIYETPTDGKSKSNVDLFEC